MMTSLRNWKIYPSNSTLLSPVDVDRNSSAASAALRKPSVSLADSMDLRVVMSVLYVMVEGMRATQDARRESFRAELGERRRVYVTCFLLHKYGL